MVGDAQDTPQFNFDTIEAATMAAQDRASGEHRRSFVVGDALDTANAGRFGVVTQGMLEGLILAADRGDHAPLAILRVVTPDGAVATVDDPGDREGRLVAFCTSG